MILLLHKAYTSPSLVHKASYTRLLSPSLILEISEIPASNSSIYRKNGFAFSYLSKTQPYQNKGSKLIWGAWESKLTCKIGC